MPDNEAVPPPPPARVSPTTVVAVLRSQLEEVRWQNVLLQAQVIELQATQTATEPTDPQPGPDQQDAHVQEAA